MGKDGRGRGANEIGKWAQWHAMRNIIGWSTSIIHSSPKGGAAYPCRYLVKFFTAARMQSYRVEYTETEQGG